MHRDHHRQTDLIDRAGAMAQQAVLYLFLFPVLLLIMLRSLVLTRRPIRRRSGGGCSDNNNNNGHDRLPPSPPGQLPIIGHLHHLMAGSSHPPHVSLRDIADEHGGLVLLQLGQVPTIVVSSPRAAEAVLRAHDHVLASRPPSPVADILLTAHLLSTTKVHSLRRAREEEVAAALAKIVGDTAGVVDVREMLGSFVNDVVCRAVSSRRHHHHGRRNRMFRELIERNTALLGGFTLYDYFPSLAWMLCARTVRNLKKRWDVLLDEIIDEHDVATNKSSVAMHEDNHDHDDRQEEADRDFVDVLLSLQQEYSLTREQVKAILMDMFAAGTDTSSVVLEYAMVELIRNPHLMTKLRADITNNTPKGQAMVKEENLHNMTYLKAVVKETLRLHPPAPLLLPRISMEKCDINGYTIPAGTYVIVNVWALGRDPMSWDKADEFMPERFIYVTAASNGTSLVDFKGRDFKFLPFGAGRRICPGMNFGAATVEIMLANLVYCFDWKLPDGLTKDDIDMTEVFGLVTRRKEKHLLVPTPLHNVNHT